MLPSAEAAFNAPRCQRRKEPSCRCVPQPSFPDETGVGTGLSFTGYLAQPSSATEKGTQVQRGQIQWLTTSQAWRQYTPQHVFDWTEIDPIPELRLNLALRSELGLTAVCLTHVSEHTFRRFVANGTCWRWQDAWMKSVSSAGKEPRSPIS